MASGQDQLAALKAAGYSDQEITSYQADRSAALLNGGFSQQEVAAYWGQKPFDSTPVKQYFEKNLAGVKDQTSFKEALDAGWQMSVTGLIARHKMPDVLLSQDAPMWARIASQVSQLAGDMPAMLAGAWAGAEAGSAVGAPTGAVIGSAIPGAGTAAGAAIGASGGALIGGGYGSFAMPAYLRRVMVDAYQKGEIKDFQDFFGRTAAAFIEAHNAGMVGALTTGVGGVVGSAAAPVMSPVAARTAKLASEVTTMVTAGKAMQGQVPNAQDFLDAAVLVGGMHLATIGANTLKTQTTRLARKLGDNYAATGIKPDEVFRDAQTDPTIRQDIASDNIPIPKKYEGVVDPSEAPAPKQPANVPEAMREQAQAVKGATPTDVAIKREPVSPVETRFSQQLSSSFQAAKTQYEALPESRGGKVINTDIARELSPEYSASKESRSALAADVHEPASAFVKQLYAEKLRQPPGPGEDNTVLFTAGGTGAGKSTAINSIPEVKVAADRAQIIYDNNLSTFSSAKTKIDQAIAAGKDVNIIYVFRDPTEALVNGALPRAERMGRTVPVAEQAKTHAGAFETIQKLQDAYKDHPSVHIDIIDNSAGKGGAKLSSMEALAGKRYNVPVEELRNAVEQQYRAGNISDRVRAGTLGSEASQPRGATSADRVPQSDRSGAGGQPEPQRAEGAGGGVTPPPKPPGPTAPGSPKEQVLARISMQDQPRGKKVTLDKVYTSLVDDLHPIKQLTKLLNGEQPLEVKDDPYQLARLTRGSTGKADHFLEFSPFKFETLKNVGKPLTRILEPVREDLDGLRAYAVSKRALELEARGIQTGVPLEAAKATVAEGAAKFDHIFQQLKEYQAHTLEYLRDSGILSAENFQKMQEANQDYVPFYRLMEEGEGITSPGGPGKALSVRSPVKQIKGSERMIVDPLESIIKNTYLYVQLAERNRALSTLAELAGSAGERGAELMERVPKTMRPIAVSESEIARFMKDNGIEGTPDALTIFRPQSQALAPDEIALYRDGAREVYRVSPEVATAVRALDQQSVSLAVKIMRAPARLLRAGTTLSPEFTVRNFVRDQMTAFNLSPRGFVPVLDTLRGLGSLFSKDEDYQNFLKSGGANSALVALDRNYIEQNIFKLERDTGLMSKTWNVLKSPLEILRATSEMVENATRLGEYKRLTKGDTDIGTVMEGGMGSREVTLDFQRIGAQTRALNMIVAFWNANIQGLDKTARSFVDRPMETTLKLGLSVTVPSVLLYMANKDDPRWKEIPRWQKDLFWIVMTKDHIYRIPKPMELGIIFGSVPERVLEAYEGQNPKAFKDLSSSLFQAFTPNYVPSFMLPVVEQFANRSTFTGNPIVPQSMEGILPEYQYSDYTSEAGKLLGKFAATMPGMKDNSLVSPMVIENYIRAWSGQLGMYALKLADEALIKSGAIPDPVKPASTLADIPVIKAFVIRYPAASAQSIQDFYDSYDKTQRRLDTIKYLAHSGDIQSAIDLMKIQQSEQTMVSLSGIKDALSTQNKYIRLVAKNPQMTPDEKRQIIDGAYYMMIQAAKQGNELIDGMNRQIEAKHPSIEMAPPTTSIAPQRAPPTFGSGPTLH